MRSLEISTRHGQESAIPIAPGHAGRTASLPQGASASGGIRLQLDRRRFLKLVGAAGVAVLSAHDVLASTGRSIPVVPAGSATLAGGPIAALADSLEFDVEQIFRFVSDEIRYEPYAGVLRGPLGTLWARAGNAVDQALLLGALLDASGLSYRFAMGALDDATAAALMASTVVDSAEARRDAAAAWEPLVPRVDSAPSPGLAPDVQQRLDEAQRSAPAVLAWARQQLDDNVATISSALAAAGLALPSGYSPMPDMERKQHVWVQVVDGATWRDLDASLPGATIGNALTTPTSTPDIVPDPLRHRVEFAIITESVMGGSLTQATSLTADAFADDLVGQPIQFLNVRPEGLKGIGVGIADAIAGKKSYLPALMIGDAAYVGGTAFGFAVGSGALNASPAPGIADGDATGQWLRITITSPDRQPVVVRRTIFDRLGDVARASGTLDMDTMQAAALTDVGPGLADEYLPAMGEYWLTVSGGQIAGDGLRAALLPVDDPRAFVIWCTPTTWSAKLRTWMWRNRLRSAPSLTRPTSWRSACRRAWTAVGHPRPSSPSTSCIGVTAPSRSDDKRPQRHPASWLACSRMSRSGSYFGEAGPASSSQLDQSVLSVGACSRPPNGLTSACACSLAESCPPILPIRLQLWRCFVRPWQVAGP